MNDQDQLEPNGLSSSELERLTLSANYSWNWFSLHAGQRLNLVNFFFLSNAFLVASFVSAVEKQLFGLALILSVAGGMVSVAFLVLDLRTRQLISIGRDALTDVETKLNMRSDLRPASRSLSERGDVIRYSVVFIVVYMTACVAYLFGIVWAARGYL